MVMEFQYQHDAFFQCFAYSFLESGGIYAVANIRGGENMANHGIGRELKCKKNVFDDFIAAAEFLIAEGYTHQKTGH